MNRWVVVLVYVLMFISLNVKATVWVSSTEPPINLGVLDTDHLEETASAQAILLDRLRREFHPRLVNLHYYDWKGIDNAIKGGTLDLILVSSTFFSTIEHNKGVKPLAGLVHNNSVDADHILAATLITTKNFPAASVKDLKGKKLFLATKTEDSNIVLMDYFYKRGISDKSFFTSIEFVKGGLEELIEKIKNNPDSVTAFPACSLEELEQSQPEVANNLHPVEGKKGEGLECIRTTQLFPGWVLASVHDKDLPMIRRATAAALTTTMAGSLQWSFAPENFEGIRNVLIDLKIGPYAADDGTALASFFRKYQYWLWGVAAIVLLLLAHSVLVAIQVRRKTKNIKSLMEEKIKYTQEMSETREKLQTMEKFQSINQMSSLLAHELQQPLGAIKNFSRGLVRKTQKGKIDNEIFNLAMNQIIAEVDKAAEIVNHVRAYAKNLPTRREFVDLNEVASASFQTFLSATNFKGRTDLILFTRPIIVEISVWEIEIVLLNLLKNAAEALSQVSDGEIKMVINCKGNTAQVFVEDNGVIADEELIQRIFKPLFSTKKNGLGLGLAIAERIAESHGGRLSAKPNNEKGLIFELCLPISKKPSNN